MKRSYTIGLALAAALGAGQVSAQELSGTLKNIKDTGAITLGGFSTTSTIQMPSFDAKDTGGQRQGQKDQDK